MIVKKIRESGQSSMALMTFVFLVTTATLGVLTQITNRTKSMLGLQLGNSNLNIQKTVQQKIDQMFEKGVLACNTSTCNVSTGHLNTSWATAANRDWDHNGPSNSPTTKVTALTFWICAPVKDASLPTSVGTGPGQSPTYRDACALSGMTGGVVQVNVNFTGFESPSANAIYAKFTLSHNLNSQGQEIAFRSLIFSNSTSKTENPGYCSYMQPMGETYNISDPDNPGEGTSASKMAAYAAATPPADPTTTMDPRWAYVFPKLKAGKNPGEFGKSHQTQDVVPWVGPWDVGPYNVMQNLIQWIYNVGYDQHYTDISVTAADALAASGGKVFFGILPLGTETVDEGARVFEIEESSNGISLETGGASWLHYDPNGNNANFTDKIKKMANGCKAIYAGNSGVSADFCIKMNVPHLNMTVKAGAQCKTTLKEGFLWDTAVWGNSFNFSLSVPKWQYDVCEAGAGKWLEDQKNSVNSYNSAAGVDHDTRSTSRWHVDQSNVGEITLQNFLDVMNRTGGVTPTFSPVKSPVFTPKPVTTGTDTLWASCTWFGWCKIEAPAGKRARVALSTPYTIGVRETSKCVYTGYSNSFNAQTCDAKTILKNDANEFLCRNEDGCFSHNTLISLADGTTKMIRDMKKSDFVWNPKTKKPSRIKRMTLGPEKKPLRRMFVGSSFVDVTEVHPFQTPEGWKKAKDLKVGDSVLGANGSFVILFNIDLIYGSTVVANIELESESGSMDDHYLLADGVVTGDLYIQEILENQK